MTLIVCPGIAAQQKVYPNGLAMDSVDPEGDAAFIRETRERLNAVRKEQHRPTVALVLSGGGAKGAATAGALKYLEEKEIPIDMICGTSIGGLIGGLYAIGYTADDIAELFRTQDWGVTLTDRIDPKYIPYNKKIEKETYVISIPFSYEKRTIKAILEDQMKYGEEQKGLSPGGEDVHLDSRIEINRFTSSLPSGYAYGLNVNNLLSSMTVGYQDSISFASLPIPYMCVAADMVSCKEKNWGSGSITSAMRSTMSIPGLFDPVRDHGMILVDGGTRNNFPTDVAKACGADFIIGIELGDLDPEYYQVNHLGNLVSQFIKMLGKDAFDKNIDRPDALIKPSISEYSMLSFNREAVDTMLSRGYAAAKEQDEALEEIMKWMPSARRQDRPSRAIDISETPVLLSSVEFDGLTKFESRTLLSKIHLKAGKYVTKASLDKAMSKIQATGAFNAVYYSLYGEQEPYRLVFHCERGPVNQVSFGFRMDSQEWASLLFNVGLNTHRLMGSKLEIDAKLGQNRSVGANWALDIPYLPTLNFEFDGSYHKGDIMNNSGLYNCAYRSYDAKVYFSNIRWTSVDFQIGAMDRYASMPQGWVMSKGTTLPDPEKDNYLSLFANAVVYTMDSKYYPSHGMELSGGYEYIFKTLEGLQGLQPASIISFKYRQVIPFGEKFAIIPSIYARSIGTDKTYSSLANFIGGDVPGRMISQQIPFVGFNEAYIAFNHAAVLNIDLRFNPFRNFYLSAQGGYLKDAKTLKEEILDFRPSFWGAGLELGYNTIIGPVKANVKWSSLTREFQFYTSLGFDF